MTRSNMTTLQRLLAKVEKQSNGCWLWTGYKQPKGYGTFKRNGTMQLAHRAAYELLRGEIPAGLQLDHLCRNRSCVNPDHLEPVTNRENCARSPIHKMNRTQCPQGHAYTPENTYINPANHGRVCRTCQCVKKRLNHILTA